jgi:hypothetical protein
MPYIIYYDDFEEGPEGIACWDGFQRASEELLQTHPEMEILVLSNRAPLSEDHSAFKDRVGICVASDAEIQEERLWRGALCIFYFSKYQKPFFEEPGAQEKLRSLDRFVLYRRMASYQKLIELLLQLKANQKTGVFHEQAWWEYYHQTLIPGGGASMEMGPEPEVEADIDFDPEVKRTDLEKHVRLHIRRKQSLDGQSPPSASMHIMYTLYRHTADEATNLIQKKCILENARNKTIQRIYLIGVEKETLLGEGLEENAKIFRLTGPGFESSFSIASVTEHANLHHSGDIIYWIRSDMVLPNQESLDGIELAFCENPKRVYALSRIERTLQGQMFKDPSCMSMMYSHEQDLYIYASPLELVFSSSSSASATALDFYRKHEELYINKLLEESGYTLYNDTERYKVIRIIVHDQNRFILGPSQMKKLECTPRVTFLPENSAVQHLPLDQMIRSCGLNEEGEYQVKKWLYEKFLLPKALHGSGSS